MSRRSADDELPPPQESPKGKARLKSSDTVPDISMEDTDAAAQQIPEHLLDALSSNEAPSPDSIDNKSEGESEGEGEPGPGESFTGAPTIAPQGLAEAGSLDFSDLATVDEDCYVFGLELARGGMGRILSARDRRTGRSVAIKEILPPLMAGLSASDKDSLVARFKREAIVTARLQHPSIVPVYEIGNFRGRPFFAMKKVEGEGLDTLISLRKTLSARLELLPTIVSVAEALAYAHGQQVVHRDLKSSNVLVGAFGETVVIDWGLAKDLSVDGDDDSIAPGTSSYDSMHPLKTVAGAIFGTPHFMPPEQARGDKVDERADVYAIGSMLYHLLSGQAPYQNSGTTSQSSSLLQKLRNEPPQPLSELIEDVPRDLLSIVDKAMSRDKRERYPSAAELAVDLADFTAGQRVAVHDYSTRELVARWLRRHRAAVATAVVLLAALIVTATISIRSVVENRDQAQAAAEVAEIEKDRADRTTDEAMEFLAERGRIDFLEDRPVHSLILLSKAYAHLWERPANQLLAAAAMRSIDSLQMTLDGHNRAITNLRLSHDKTKLMSSSEDGGIRVWDIESGAMLSSFEGDLHASSVVPSFSSDDSQVAMAGKGSARVWDVTTGELVASLKGSFVFASFDHKDRVITVAADGQVSAWLPNHKMHTPLHKLERLGPLWSPAISIDGKKLVVTLTKIFVIDLETDTLRGQSFGFGSKLVALESNGDRQRFVTADNGGKLRLWDLDSVKLLGAIALGERPEQNVSIRFSPDGKLLASVTPERGVEILSMVTHKKVATMGSSDAGATHLIFSPDSKILVTLGRDEVARTWDVATGRARSSFVGHSEIGTAAVFSADGRSVFIGDSAGGIRKWDTSVDIVRRELPSQTSYTARDPSGKRVLVADEESLQLVDSSTLKVIAKFGAAAQLNLTNFSGDGSRLFTGTGVYSSVDGSEIRSVQSEATPNALTSISHDGGLVGLSTREKFRIWNADSGELVHEEMNSNYMRTPVYLAHDGESAMAMLKDFRLTLLNFKTGERLDHFGDTKITRDLVTFVKKPEHAVINRRPKGLDLVNIKTGKVVHRLKGIFNLLSLAPDGVRILAASNNSAFLWNTESGEVEKMLWDPQIKSIYALAISANGHFVALASHNAVSIYDRESESMLLRVSLGTQSIKSLSFTDADETLVIGVNGRLLALDIRRETREPAVISALVKERVSRILKNGHFLPAQPIDSKDNSKVRSEIRTLYVPFYARDGETPEEWQLIESASD